MENNNNNTGIGFFGLLAIAFIVLKLTKVINWTWLWVLSPLWIPFAIVVVLLIVFAIIEIASGNKEGKED